MMEIKKPKVVVFLFIGAFLSCLLPVFICRFDNGDVTGRLKFSTAISSKIYGYAMVSQIALLTPGLIDLYLDCFLPILYTSYPQSFRKPIIRTILVTALALISLVDLTELISGNYLEGAVTTYFIRQLLYDFIECIRLHAFIQILQVDQQLVFCAFFFAATSSVFQCWSAFSGVDSMSLVLASTLSLLLCSGFAFKICYRCCKALKVKSWESMTMFERDGWILVHVFPIVIFLHCIAYSIFRGVFTAEGLAINVFVSQILPLSKLLGERRNILAEAFLNEQILEKKRNFVRLISHEIRTPLNIVNTGLDLLRLELLRHDASPDALDTWIDVKKSTKVSVGILDELLLYEKLESGVLTLDIGDIQCWPFLKEIVRSFRLQVA